MVLIGQNVVNTGQFNVVFCPISVYTLSEHYKKRGLNCPTNLLLI